ncbi:hypothetical protein AB0H83_28150 [Dactylosporangium sp. NPDC050688]|uniref:hypothetical protein n=1 Tax=Dactylosporangium sp. NPDC050688 TaxID=3157217 RepID=UPI0033F7B8C1
MNDFDWDFDNRPVRGTDVRRRLMLDLRSYDVTAFDDGSGVVGLRLVGWDSGYMFTEVVAELPTGDAADVGQLLASALAGFRGGGSPPSPTPASGWLSYDARDSRPATASKWGQPWEPADLDLLVRRFREGATIKTLTAELGRTDGAIRQRLQILGETRPGPASNVAAAARAEASEGLPDEASEELAEEVPDEAFERLPADEVPDDNATVAPDDDPGPPLTPSWLPPGTTAADALADVLSDLPKRAG